VSVFQHALFHFILCLSTFSLAEVVSSKKRMKTDAIEDADETSERRESVVSRSSGNSDRKRAADCDDASQEQTRVDNFMTFPERLMSLLGCDESAGSIYWTSGGDSFRIKTKDFTEKVLKVHFQGTKFESFVRKLNRWGFKRVHDQDLPYGTIAYRHPMFQKGKPELLKNMSGVKKKEIDSQRHILLLQEQAAAFNPSMRTAIGSIPPPDTSLVPRTSFAQAKHPITASPQFSALQSHPSSFQQALNQQLNQQQLQLEQVLSAERAVTNNQIRQLLQQSSGISLGSRLMQSQQEFLLPPSLSSQILSNRTPANLLSAGLLMGTTNSTTSALLRGTG